MKTPNGYREQKQPSTPQKHAMYNNTEMQIYNEWTRKLSRRSRTIYVHDVAYVNANLNENVAVPIGIKGSVAVNTDAQQFYIW